MVTIKTKETEGINNKQEKQIINSKMVGLSPTIQ